MARIIEDGFPSLTKDATAGIPTPRFIFQQVLRKETCFRLGIPKDSSVVISRLEGTVDSIGAKDLVRSLC